LPPSGTTPVKRPDVGYGRPPIEHQFKAGESGNRRGRPKGSQNEATIINEIFRRKIEVCEKGKTRRISILEAIFLKFVEDALRGSSKSAAFLLNRKALAESSEQPETAELDMDDRKVLEFHAQKIWEQFKRQEDEK
jgi:hypothetical protein